MYISKVMSEFSHDIITDFVLIFQLIPCKSCHFDILLTEAGVMHEAGYVDYLEHIVPLLIWILTSCPFYIIWEVLLAYARKISYTYTNSIASKVFNYKQSLRDFKLNEYGSQPPLCSCSSSTYLYSPAGHVVTGNLNIVENLKLRDILSKGPKYRKPTTFSWKYNFKLVMDSVEDYARRWAKEEEVELDSLPEWIKSIRHLLKRRMYMAGRSINNKPKSVFSDTDVTEHLADLHNRCYCSS